MTIYNIRTICIQKCFAYMGIFRKFSQCSQCPDGSFDYHFYEKILQLKSKEIFQMYFVILLKLNVTLFLLFYHAILSANGMCFYFFLLFYLKRLTFFLSMFYK